MIARHAVLPLLLAAAIMMSGCERNEKGVAPQIPPYTTMAMDFSQFDATAKSALSDSTRINFAAAGLTLFAWNAALTTTLAVPVMAFRHSFDHLPTHVEGSSWQWAYSVQGFANTHNARLVGTVRRGDVLWQMYISREGIFPHDEFLWFEGTSELDGNGGQWILYHSHAHPYRILQIDWTRAGDSVAMVKYTYVHEADNDNPRQLTVGSSITYGLAQGELDAYYSIVYNTRDRGAAQDLTVNIEWSRATHQGRIKAPHYFLNESWHCWNSQGYDSPCD